jgi:coenzyme F420 hydrogenase subunit beta
MNNNSDSFTAPGGGSPLEPRGNAGAQQRSFSDLEKDIVSTGLCSQCGGCVSFCSANKLGALEMSPEGIPRYLDEEKCLKCGLCYSICTQVDELDQELKEKFDWVPPMGRYDRVASARTTNHEIRSVCTDGGVVTSLLMYMMDYGLIDGAVVSRFVGPFNRVPMVATTREDILNSAGSDFSASTHVGVVGDEYNTFSPGAFALKDLTSSMRASRLALVGTPCQVHTISKMQCLNIVPSDMVKYSIGLFCMENFAFSSLAKQEIEAKIGASMDEIRKLNIKSDLLVTLTNGKSVHIPFDVVNDFARPACLKCIEFANDYADISVGGLGSPDGYTTVLTRTEVGQGIYQAALKLRYIEERTYDSYREKAESQMRMITKIIDFVRLKRSRVTNTGHET